MDRRQAIAALVHKTGIKLDEDDPAFLLVELNALMLDHKMNEASQRLASETARLNQVMTENVDDFVAVANEALSKFMVRTNEIKELLDALNTKAATTKPATVVEPTQKKEPQSMLWWLVPTTLVVGVLLGVILALLLK